MGFKNDDHDHAGGAKQMAARKREQARIATEIRLRDEADIDAVETRRMRAINTGPMEAGKVKVGYPATKMEDMAYRDASKRRNHMPSATVPAGRVKK